MFLTKNFTFNEFKCPLTGECEMDHSFIYKLQKMRTMYGKPIYISSGYRSLEHNIAIGGAEKSLHMFGMAADLKVKNSQERYQLVRFAIWCGFNGIGVYDHHVHVDTRDKESLMWVGVSK